MTKADGRIFRCEVCGDDMTERVILFPNLPDKPCDECRHRGRIPDSAGITDGCYHRGVVLGMRYPECYEPERKEVPHDSRRC